MSRCRSTRSDSLLCRKTWLTQVNVQIDQATANHLARAIYYLVAILGRNIFINECNLSSLDSYIQTHGVDVVALTIPQSVAQEMASRLINLGVKGFWNFTNVELSSSDSNVKFENIHFADSLLILSYRIANR